MNQPKTIMVVDDDVSIVELMRDFLINDGFRVVTAHDANSALAAFRRQPADCLIVDVMMPGQDGFELCRKIRETSNVPILFLSARDDDIHKIRGLGIGGDDYIVKTASPVEVIARVKAVLRRAAASGQGTGQTAGKVIDYGRLQLNFATREISVNGEQVFLTPKEFEVFRLLAEHPRQVFTYEQLLDQFWDGVGDKHTVRVLMARMREKIEAEPGQPPYITNVWGIGYRFEGLPQ
ncbi:response regulator transcription factor [Paenibacillus doosanensis]|uniref:Sensory transduction protein regX3 n=1 Tax=Paenibacillus konkukensis TaxID=2020716 RepID=A0ABY4RUJ5_9BACL|nr:MULTISPECIES: response regulator transcription factor [Paenibacillus]MCS7460985.1 response regulator transcription factor [Paenibacillus doosanensis]UQZ85655.1 Sensory transduction protein regX3 [Paenibacillus konkukensis]